MRQIIPTLALLLAFAITARAESPLMEIKSTTENVLLLLKNPKVQGESKAEERRQLVRGEMEKRFAWEQTARACLGRHWAERTPAEKVEFVKIFSGFLKDNYSNKIATYYGDLDKVDYQKEKIIDNYASVKLVLVTKSKIEHPIEYRMEKSASGDDWKIYDVVIEGVSLVKNYRDQFDAILANSSYAGLIKEIQSKQPTTSKLL